MELQELMFTPEGDPRPIQDIIADLKSQKLSLNIPKWEKLRKEYYPEEHRIKTDKDWWKDKGKGRKKKEVARITYAMQRGAANKATQMGFAIPVRRIYTGVEDNETSKAVKDALDAIYSRVHIDNLNRKRMKMYFASCELLTIWYAVEGAEEHHDYGFATKYKLRCKSFSPMDGYELYPIFDDYDDLLGMCLEYDTKKIVNGAVTTITQFEVFVPQRHLKFTRSNNKWAPTLDEKVKIGKLPLAYMYRQMPIWEDQTSNCDEIELALSRESEILRLNSAPYLQVSGQIKKEGVTNTDPMAQAGLENPKATQTAKKQAETADDDDARRIIRTENGGAVNYVTWAQSIEAMKFFIQELKNNSYEQLQLADLSMQNLKSLGGVGYEARQTLLTDPHLKIGEESGEIIIFLEREHSVVSEFLSLMKADWKDTIKKMRCEHVITPFIQNDEKSEIEKWKSACGEVIASQRSAMKFSGLHDNVDDELKQIRKEEAERNSLQYVNDVHEEGVE